MLALAAEEQQQQDEIEMKDVGIETAHEDEPLAAQQHQQPTQIPLEAEFPTTTTTEAEVPPPPPPSESTTESIIASIIEDLIAAAEGPTITTTTISTPAAVLAALRAKIPATITSLYAEPLAVSEEDAAAAAERSAIFHTELARQKTIVRAKPDLKAVKSLQQRHPEWPVWEKNHGHPPGILPGQSFTGRAELWLAGAHKQYFRGIDSAGDAPAYAIVLSGEYEDDADHGDYLYYTGEGGKAAGGSNQAKNQAFTGGNAGLRRNFEQGVPVRVMRGAKSAEGEISYTYDGLYCVTSAELVQGRSGFLVCIFTLVGIPGHYKACRKVSFLSVRGFKNIQLALGSGEGVERAKRARTQAPKTTQASGASSAGASTSKAAAAAAAAPKRKRATKRGADGIVRYIPVDKEKMIKEFHARPGLVCEDISSGVELWPIPVFNETNDGEVPTDLEYIRESRVFESTDARDLIAAGLAVMPGTNGSWCGIRHAVAHPSEFPRLSYNVRSQSPSLLI